MYALDFEYGLLRESTNESDVRSQFYACGSMGRRKEKI